MKFFRVNDIIGIPCKAILLVAAIIVGLSGPVAAMTTAEKVMLFFVGTTEILPGVETLTDIDLNTVTDIDGNDLGTL